jgi:hypothetical protein
MINVHYGISYSVTSLYETPADVAQTLDVYTIEQLTFGRNMRC